MTTTHYPLPPEPCFACGTLMRRPGKYIVVTEDGSTQWVGHECWKKIAADVTSGWQPPKGGPRLFWTRQPTQAEVDAYRAKLLAKDIAEGIE